MKQPFTVTVMKARPQIDLRSAEADVAFLLGYVANTLAEDRSAYLPTVFNEALALTRFRNLELQYVGEDDRDYAVVRTDDITD